MNQHRPRVGRLGLAIRLGLLGLLPLPTLAQDAAGDEPAELVTITVTAQKREQQVQEVPIAVTAYSGEFLQDLGVTGFDDLAAYVPGLEVQVQSPNTPGFVIRGITSDDAAANVEPRVSVFQDGISISRAQGSVVELFDLERIEVLRGPQGTLFGRSAQIGAVHVIQAKARNESSALLRLGFGNHGSQELSGHWNAPIVDDRVYARLALHHAQRDGYIENLSGGDLNGKDTTALRFSLRADIGERHSLDLIVNHQKDSGPGTAFRSGVIPTRAGSTDAFGAADLNRGEALGLDRHVNGVTLLGEFWLSDSWSLSTLTGWREYGSREEFDADGSQVFLLEFAEDAEGDQFSQELRFNYDGGGAFRGFTGLSWFDSDSSQRVPFATDERSLYALLSPLLSGATGGALPIVPLLSPDGTPNFAVPPALPGLLPGLPPFIPLKPLHREEYANFGRVRALEIFADGTWSVNDRLDLTLGVRATREQVRAGYEALFFGAPSALGQLLPSFPTEIAFPNALFPPVPRTEASDTFTSYVGRAVAQYRFSDDLNAYASVSRGRRPDVIQIDAGGAERVPAEIVWSYEVGVKGAADEGRLVYDAAVFYYDYSNFQAQVVNPTPPPFFVATNAGNARAKGAEFSLMRQFSPGLRAFANLGWIDAKFNAFDDDGNPQSLAGNRFRLTPEYSGSVGLDWSIALAGDRSVYIRPSYSWKSQVYFEDDNQPGIEQGSYGLLGLRAGIRFGERWEIGAWVSNALGEDYLIDAGNTGALFGIPTYIPGAPRFYGLQLTGRL